MLDFVFDNFENWFAKDKVELVFEELLITTIIKLIDQNSK